MASEYNIRAHTCANLCDEALCATMKNAPFVCTESGTVMDAKYLEGPDTNCPMGQWAKHRAQAISNVDASIAKRLADAQAQKAADIAATEKLMADLNLDNTEATRTILVSNGFLEPDIAAELEVKGLDEKAIVEATQ